MDFIKKTICIEGARTRTQGLMPYYEVGTDNNGLVYADGENGNWGQFVANPTFLSNCGKTYEAMLYKYYSLLNTVRNSVKLRKVETKEGEIIYTEDVSSFFQSGSCFEDGEEPGFLYEYSAYPASDFYSTEIDSLREETRRIYRYTGEEEIKDTFIVLVDDYDDFLKLSKYLSGTTYITDLGDLNPEDIYTGSEHNEWARYCSVVDLCIGKINIPAWIYNAHIKAPKSMPCADVEPYIEWLQNYPGEDCCNTRLYEDMGGNDMLEYLLASAKTKCNSFSTVINGLGYSVPYIEMPLLLVQSYTDVGVLTNVDGVDYDSSKKGPSARNNDITRPHGELQLSRNRSGFTKQDEINLLIHSGIGVSIDQIIMCDGNTRRTYPTTEEYEANPSAYTNELGFTNYPVEVESQLQTLRATKKYIDDKNNVLPGLFEHYEEDVSGKMFRCIRQGEETFWDLKIDESSYTQSGVTYHTLEFYWSLNPSYTKEDINPNNFYQGFPVVPYGRYTVSENQSNWQQLYDTRKQLMETYATPDAHTPISVAKNEWRMEEIPYDVTDFINGDGEQSETLHYPEQEVNNIRDKMYRTITTEAAGIRIAETEEEENGEDQPFMEHYYFKVKYDNSAEKPMILPYIEGNVANVYVYDSATSIYRGDFILPGYPKIIGDEIEVKYVIGGYFKGDEDGRFVSYVVDTGDVYYEKHPYVSSYLDYVPLDGVDKVPVWSEYIDFDADAKEFYSSRYNLYRTGNTANIIEATTGEQWVKKYPGGDEYSYSFDAYLTKEEYLTNFSLPPKIDVDVTIDRGGVSAFEKHYKLSECNTMQDLINYNNGEFFPD